MSRPKAQDPRVDKRRVTMRNFSTQISPETGEPVIVAETAIDYVRPDFLDAYVTNARKRWQDVEVSEEPDAGPGGYHGETSVPSFLDHPLAGQTFPATPEDERD